MFKQPSSVTFGPDCWPWVLDERKLWTLGGAGSHTQKKRRCKTNSPTLRKERALFGPLSDLQDPRPVRHPPLPERPSPTLSPSSSPGAHSVLAFIRLRKGSWTDLFSTYFDSNEELDVSCLKPWPWILLTSTMRQFNFKALFYFFLTFYFLWLHPASRHPPFLTDGFSSLLQQTDCYLMLHRWGLRMFQDDKVMSNLSWELNAFAPPTNNGFG